MRVHLRNGFTVILATAALLAGCHQEKPASTGEGPTSVRTTTTDAYIYGYPLVLMDVTRAKLTNVPHPEGPGAAPPNQFGHIKTFPDATFTDVRLYEPEHSRNCLS